MTDNNETNDDYERRIKELSSKLGEREKALESELGVSRTLAQSLLEAERRLGRAVELFNRYNLRPGEEGQQALCDLEDVLKGGVVERQSQNGPSAYELGQTNIKPESKYRPE